MRNLKLRHLGYDFKIDEKNKVVVCKATFMMTNSRKIITTGIAQAKNEEFKEEVGKKLAKARAEKEAFVRYAEILREQIRKNTDKLLSLELSLDYTKKYLDRQKTYIKTF